MINSAQMKKIVSFAVNGKRIPISYCTLLINHKIGTYFHLTRLVTCAMTSAVSHDDLKKEFYITLDGKHLQLYRSVSISTGFRI